MWVIKVFKTKEKMTRFIKRHEHRIQWNEVFVNNGYAIEYRLLRKIM